MPSSQPAKSIEEIAFCNESGRLWTEPTSMNPYAQWTGDLEGLIEVAWGSHGCTSQGTAGLQLATRTTLELCGIGWIGVDGVAAVRIHSRPFELLAVASYR